MSRDRMIEKASRTAAVLAALATLLSRFGLPPGGAAMLLASGLMVLAVPPIAAVLVSEIGRARRRSA